MQHVTLPPSVHAGSWPQKVCQRKPFPFLRLRLVNHSATDLTLSRPSSSVSMSGLQTPNDIVATRVTSWHRHFLCCCIFTCSVIAGRSDPVSGGGGVGRPRAARPRVRGLRARRTCVRTGPTRRPHRTLCARRPSRRLSRKGWLKLGEIDCR